MSSKAPRSLRAKIGSALGISIGVLGIGFVTRTVITRWDEVRDAFAQFEPVTLAGSLALAVSALCIIGGTWSRILHQRGQKAPLATSLSWYFTGQLGKYVPGGIWAIVGRAEMAVRGGVSRTDAYVSTGISMTTTYIASICVIGIGSVMSWTYPVIGGAVLAGLVVGFFVYSLPAFHSAALAISTKFLPKGLVLTETQSLIRYSLYQVPAWVLMSLSTSITASAFSADIGVAHMAFITATSWFVGFVAIGVPGGIGVRESVFTAMATSAIGAPMAVSIALASRVVFIFADVIGAVVSTSVVRALQPQSRK